CIYRANIDKTNKYTHSGVLYRKTNALKDPLKGYFFIPTITMEEIAYFMRNLTKNTLKWYVRW
ncbi:MAG: hypothetical protein WCM93_15840, partial [Bacteroidota bacterium]